MYASTHVQTTLRSTALRLVFFNDDGVGLGQVPDNQLNVFRLCLRLCHRLACRCHFRGHLAVVDLLGPQGGSGYGVDVQVAASVTASGSADP